jgi:hypothetical protein
VIDFYLLLIFVFFFFLSHFELVNQCVHIYIQINMGTEGSIPVNREKRHPPEGIEQGHHQEEQVIVRKEVRKKAKENRGKYPKKDYGRSVSKHYNVSDAVKLTFNQLGTKKQVCRARGKIVHPGDGNLGANQF